MKKIKICFLLVLGSSFLIAQSVNPDTTFGVQGLVETNLRNLTMNPYGNSMVVLQDGEAVIAGGINEHLKIEKYGNDGVLDNAFTVSLPNISGYSFGLSNQEDGKIIAAGHQRVLPYHACVIRLNINGGMDTTFGIFGIADAFLERVYDWHLLEQSNGNILGYGAQQLSGIDPFLIATRFFADGSIDSTFGENGLFRFNVVSGYEFIPMGLEQQDGKLVFAGMANWQVLLLRLNPDGTKDSTFSKDGILIDSIADRGEAFCLTLQADGKILAGGYSRKSGFIKSLVVRYHPNGDRDSTFGINGVQNFSNFIGNHEVVGIEALPNGKIIMLISDFSTQNVTLAQLLPNGQIDISFGSNGIYQYSEKLIRCRSFSSNGNKITVSGSPISQQKIHLLRFILDLNVGILDPKAPYDPKLWVYPNPISEQFNLEFELTQLAQVSAYLTDIQGKRVHFFGQNQIFEPGEHALTLSCPSHLPAGNYVLSLDVAGKKMTSVQVTKK